MKNVERIMNNLFFETAKEIILHQPNVNVLDTNTNEELKQNLLKEKNCNFFEGERRVSYGFVMLESQVNDNKMYVVLDETFDKNGDEKYEQLSIVFHFEELRQKIDFHYNIHNAEDSKTEYFEKQFTEYIKTHKLNYDEDYITEVCIAFNMLSLSINATITQILLKDFNLFKH